MGRKNIKYVEKNSRKLNAYWIFIEFFFFTKLNSWRFFFRGKKEEKSIVPLLCKNEMNVCCLFILMIATELILHIRLSVSVLVWNASCIDVRVLWLQLCWPLALTFKRWKTAFCYQLKHINDKLWLLYTECLCILLRWYICLFSFVRVWSKCFSNMNSALRLTQTHVFLSFLLSPHFFYTIFCNVRKEDYARCTLWSGIANQNFALGDISYDILVCFCVSMDRIAQRKSKHKNVL